MTTKYYALLTNLGAGKLANAAALGTQLKITHMAVGDGGGSLPTPNASQTKLVGEQRRAALNSLSIDAANSSQIIAEQVIPESEGNFWIREIGLFDADGVMIAVANCPETYKPTLQEGSGRTQTVRMILIVNSTDAVTLKIDPSVVLATRKYVDDAVIEVKAYADNLMAAHVKAADPHTQYAPKASPALTGTPTAPTAGSSTNNTQIATTAFVQALHKAMRSSATDSNSEETVATSKALKEVKDGSLPVKGVPPGTITDINDMGPTSDYVGIWNFSGSAQYTLTNVPEANAGRLEVYAAGAFNGSQEYTTRYGAKYVRSLTASWNAASPSWGPWQLVGDQPVQGYISTDLNNVVTPGTYSVTSTANINSPFAAGLTGILEVKLRLSTNSVKQTFTAIVSATSVYANRTWQRTLSGTSWSAWNEVAKFSDIVPVMAGISSDLNNISASGVYPVASDAPNNPAAGSIGLLTHLNYNETRFVQEFATAVASAASTNRRWVRYGSVSGSTASWTPWTQTTMRPNEIAAGTDLNSLTESGIYYGGGFVNGPPAMVNAYGSVEVIATGTGGAITQAVHAVTANRKFIRSYNASVNGWSEWAEQARTDLIASNLVPVGIIMTWPTATPPAGWIKCNGAAFSATAYPELAKVYTNLKVPDLRGEFIRGFDDGRGVDSGRVIATGQGATSIRTAAVDYPGIDTTTEGATVGTPYSKADSVSKGQPTDARSPADGVLGSVLSDNSIQGTQFQSGIPGGAVWITMRPRNVAFNFIVRAA